MPVSKLEAEFAEFLQRLRATPDFVTKFLPALEKAWNASAVERAASIRKAKAELQEQRELKKSLVKALLKGIIDKPTYEEMKQEADDQCEGLEAWLGHLGSEETRSVLFWTFSQNVLLDVSTAWMRGLWNSARCFKESCFRRV